MLIPIYKSTRTFYERSIGDDGQPRDKPYATHSVEAFEPFEYRRHEQRRCIGIIEASTEPSAWVRVPDGTKLVTLDVPGSPVNPLVFAEIPHPKKPGAYLTRELPSSLLAVAGQKLHGCELAAAPVEAVELPEIDRNVVVVPPASEAKPVEAESAPVVADDQVEVVMEQLAELVTETVKAEYTEAEQRIDAAIERARQMAWQEHQAMARPTAPKAGRKRVAADQGSLF